MSGHGRPYRAVATHEAGHGIAARLFGASVGGIRVFDVLRGETTYGSILTPEGGDERSRWELLARMVAAGPVAEMILGGEACGDFRFDRRAFGPWGDDAEALTLALASARMVADATRVIAEVERMLRLPRNWQAVEDVARIVEGLAEAEAPAELEIPGEEADRIVREALEHGKGA